VFGIPPWTESLNKDLGINAWHPSSCMCACHTHDESTTTDAKLTLLARMMTEARWRGSNF